MTKNSVEIVCSKCGVDALLIREPVYEGFAKVGVLAKCSNCGHAYADEKDVVFRDRERIEVFDDTDRSAKVELFGDEEKHILCRYCRHYVVNPFTQWCGHRKREVAATDTCVDFECRKDADDEERI